MGIKVKLVDLNPRWVGYGGDYIFASEADYKAGKSIPGREKIGISFDCPCGKKEMMEDHNFHACTIEFKNPVDGLGPVSDHNWERIGDTFETLTLRPSILRMPERGGCGWHGYLTVGVFESC